MSVNVESAPTPNERLAYKWKVLISVIFGIFMVILDTTVVNVAFQTLRQEFAASLNDSQWIISVYVLSLGISTPLSGFLGDRFGLKRIYLLGLGLFITGSLLSGISPGLWTLVAARALQGLGGGIALPLGAALLFRAFPADEQGTALGIFGIALVMAPAIGPILGGWLVDHNLWRWIFFINLPIGVVGLYLANRFLRTEGDRKRERVDVFGLITEVVGFGAVLYGASLAADRGWTSPGVILWFGIGLTGLTYFSFVELYAAKAPLLDLRLFKKRVFALANFIGYVSVLALFGAEFLLPVYLQALRGYSAFDTGLILLPLAITAGIFTPLAGKLYDKVGPRPLLTIGFIVLAVNTWQLSLLDATTTIEWILFLLVLRGFALGMTVQTTFVTALAVVPLPEIARGSSLTNATRQVVQSIGVAVLATVLASTLSPEVRAFQTQFEEHLPPPGSDAPRVALCDPSTLPAALTQGPPAAMGSVGGVPPAGLQAAPGVPPTGPQAAPGVPPTGPQAAPGGPMGGAAQILGLVDRACQESVKGFERAYRLTFYFALLALALGLLLPGWPFKWEGRRSADGPPMGH